MLVVGELDRNVDPASTILVVKALNEAEKDDGFFLCRGKDVGWVAVVRMR